MMLLAFDIGNTNIVAALFEGCDSKAPNSKAPALIAQWRLNTQPVKTVDEWMVAILGLFHIQGYNIGDVKGSVIASVVPAATGTLSTMCQSLLHVEPVCVGSEGINVGIDIRVDNPKEVGADRLVNAVAAKSLYGNNLIIIDFGTATTFDVVDDKGCYSGGVIAPGIHLSMKALHMGTAQLPAIEIVKPAKIMGTNTVDAMRSGVYYGYVHAIEGICNQLKQECGNTPMKVIATGGLAPLFADGCKSIEYVEPHLTMLGLKLIYGLNQ